MATSLRVHSEPHRAQICWRLKEAGDLQEARRSWRPVVQCCTTDIIHWPLKDPNRKHVDKSMIYIYICHYVCIHVYLYTCMYTCLQILLQKHNIHTQT